MLILNAMGLRMKHFILIFPMQDNILLPDVVEEDKIQEHAIKPYLDDEKQSIEYKLNIKHLSY